MEVNSLDKQEIITGTNDMEKLIQTCDWSATPVGAMAEWPQSLRTSISIMLQTHVPMFVAWGPSLTLFYNDAFRPLLARHPHTIGQSAYEVFQEMQPDMKPAFDSALQGKPITLNEVLIPVNGHGSFETAHFTFSVTPVQVESGAIGGIVVTATEATSQLIIEKQKLEKSEQYFRRLADTIPVMLWMTRPDGLCTYVNQKWYDYTGQTPENTLGTDWQSVVHPDDVERMRTGFAEANQQQAPFYLEYRIKGANGHYRWILDSGSPVFDEQGMFEGFIGSVIDINNRKLAEDAIRESEERFRVVANSAPVMLWMANTAGQFTFFNKGWLEFTGRSIQQELGEAWQQGIRPDDLQYFLGLFNEAFDAQHEIEIEFRLQRQNGYYRWVAMHGVPRHAYDGTFLGYIGSCLDVHERKTIRMELEKRVAERTNEISRKNKELEEQNLFVEAIFDASVDLMAVVDKELRYVSANKKYLEVYGLVKENVLGKKMTEIISGIEGSPILYGVQKAFTGEHVHHIAYRYPLIKRDYETFFVPLKNAEGEIYSVVLIAHDNTQILRTTEELKQMNSQLETRNEELRQSEERYLRMTNEVEDYAIILLSRDGYIENWNKGAEKIKGYATEDIIGKHIRVFYTQSDQQMRVPEKLIEEAVVKGKSTYEGLRVRKDGSTFWANTVITALHNDKNDVIGFSKVTRDLTERKVAEDQSKIYAEQLEQKNRELERSNSELSSFSYVASHDLQEPLRKIQAFGNLIQSRDGDNMSDISKDYFDRMVKAAVRMQNLIDSLLEFSRTTTGRRTFETTDLNILLDEVKKELTDRIEEKKAIVQSAHMPTLTVIPFQFRQLLSNLINNSLKYSRTGVTPVIEIKAEYIYASEMKEAAAIPRRDYYKFSVADNGIGFEQEYAEKIFELFQRLHGRNEYSGSGIGLAICKKIVENHNGFIRAESEPNKGATIYFFIPVR